MLKNAVKRFPLGVIIGLLLLGFFLVLRSTDGNLVKDIRNRSFDLYQTIKPREYTPQPVRIIDIDEKSLREVGQWPWPRTTIAELIDKIGGAGAAVIGFDIVFSERDRLSPRVIARDNKTIPENMRDALTKLPDNEIAMREAMKRHRVVLGETSVRNYEDRTIEEREFEDAPFAQLGEDPRPFLHPFADLVQNVSELDEAATGKGVFSVDHDPDGIVRRIPLVLKLRDKVRLALSAETLRVATGDESFSVRTTVAGIQEVIVAGNPISTDVRGNIWPYFSPPVAERYLSAGKVLAGTFDPSLLSGHIVLVGTSAVGLEDYRSIPIGERVPGVEIHAQVIENLLTNQKLYRPFFTELYELGSILLTGLIIVLAVPRLGASWSAVLALGIIAGIIAASWWAFSRHQMLIDATLPTLSTITLFLAMGLANYLREERQKQQIRTAFGQYLSPALVNRLSENPDQLKLGGSTRELTVLFTDIRGFTTISESYKDHPQGLTQLMNRFLTELSQPILDRNGTIDKYMGDAIMAFWNAPFDYEHHVLEACIAALEMLENIEKLNAERAEELKDKEDEVFHEINVGIGINTGLCVVGNMGSTSRFDYTALGDTVNIASRLEGQSKPYGLPIVIGPETADTVKGTLAVFEIDLLRVKGKNEPIRVYSLSGDESLANTETFEEFRALNSGMIASYRAQEWDAAFDALEMLEELGEKLGIPVDEYLLIYEARITEYQANPPGADWDGVYTAMSK